MLSPDLSALDTLRERGEGFLEEVSREYHAAHAGLKATADLQPIYDRHREAYGDEAYALARGLFQQSADGSEERRSARMLLEWLVESRVGRELVALEEREIAWESSAVIPLAGGSVEPYQRASITIANTRDAKQRNAIDDARAALVQQELFPLRQERLARERAVVEATRVAPDYNSIFETLSGLSLQTLRRECEGFLRTTQAMWDDVLPEFLKRGLGLAPSDATRADALALMRVPEFDASFPVDAMEPGVRQQLSDMGASPDAHGRVRYDTMERAGKRARAFCAAVRIPDEVHLVLRPHGGLNDWRTLLHEIGHALHFANMDRALPFEFRWLGDNSITEGFAMLFDHRMQDPGWLARYTRLGKNDLPRYLRAAGFEELHFIRRYCAKLIYEVQLYSGAVDWRSLPDLYVETLSRATGFRYQRADAFVDVDPRFYAARYLRAWQLQAVLAETLVERYNADWWRNPRAGPWIVGELFARGQRELAEEQAKRVSGKVPSFAPLVRAIEQLLN
ncbi:MAG TPA: hypothetical protein VHE78_02665 [Gemmatimonadaceae bacterium]|nr:hypothetical protein [Gemmatimonadaceae bacterium]